jgi:hypothetical protein
MKSAIALIGLAGALAFTSAAYAGNAGDGSAYGTQPGYNVATGNTQCAGAGAFGAFGKAANLGIQASPGNGDPQHATFLGSFPGPGTTSQTGINNSTLCGNPQGSPQPN